MQKLHPIALGIACGATSAIALVLLAIVAMINGSYGNSLVSLISTIYVGFRPSIPGALLGGLWGFVDGAIGGWVFAQIYNKVLDSSKIM